MITNMIRYVINKFKTRVLVAIMTNLRTHTALYNVHNFLISIILCKTSQTCVADICPGGCVADIGPGGCVADIGPGGYVWYFQV